MMERLTHQGEHGPYWDKSVFDQHGGMEEDLILDRLAYYEDMEEQGRLVVLPCKVGDRIYRIYDDCTLPGDCGTKRMCKGCEYRNLFIEEQRFVISMLNGFGKLAPNYYLTREEAENALATDKNVGSKNGGAE